MTAKSTVCPRFAKGMVAMMEMYSEGVEGNVQNPFEGNAAITVREYTLRLLKYCATQEEDVVMAVMLLDRLVYRYPECRLSKTSFHRMFLVALVVSVKTRSDFYYANSYYAQAGGVDLKQFNELERLFLNMIEFDVYIEVEDYDTFYAAVDAQFYISTPPPAPLSLQTAEQLKQQQYYCLQQQQQHDDAISQYSNTSYETSHSYPGHYPNTAYPTSPPVNIWYSSSVVNSNYCY
eukprot:TRINITY_DN2109_c2_g1_i2.p1 TRINITY_DN2109_c2_g1~~TRINITY_DN2109_c2_g1_i2.p1  ORF type:complete len:250 (+),score=83.57 TRINITY_DN2109_c2_g1_i2:51-752(+)